MNKSTMVSIINRMLAGTSHKAPTTDARRCVLELVAAEHPGFSLEDLPLFPTTEARTRDKTVSFTTPVPGPFFHERTSAKSSRDSGRSGRQMAAIEWVPCLQQQQRQGEMRHSADNAT